MSKVFAWLFSRPAGGASTTKLGAILATAGTVAAIFGLTDPRIAATAQAVGLLAAALGLRDAMTPKPL